MIIKPFIILSMAIILVAFLRTRGDIQASAWKKIGAVLLFILAIVTVISPNLTNVVATSLGIGRGADLLLYIVTLAFLGNLVGQYSHAKKGQAKLNSLARKVAINEANILPANQKKIKIKNQ